MIDLNVSRRTLLRAGGAFAALGLAGCATTAQPVVAPVKAKPIVLPTAESEMYGARPDEQFPLPAIPYQKVPPRFRRQWVDNTTGERPGTLVVDTANHFLYLTYEDGKAMRYGVGLGRAGFEWAGRGVIQYKRKWPRWTPPNEMVARRPDLEPYSIANGGMDPGLKNPLGARALYIFKERCRYDLPYPRFAGMVDDRQIGVVRLCAHAQSGCDRSSQPGAQPHRNPGDRGHHGLAIHGL